MIDLMLSYLIALIILLSALNINVRFLWRMRMARGLWMPIKLLFLLLGRVGHGLGFLIRYFSKGLRHSLATPSRVVQRFRIRLHRSHHRKGTV